MPARERSWSLARRLTGGIVAIALLAFVSQALVLDFWIRPLLDELAADTASHAHSIATALSMVLPADRPALARRLSGESLRIGREAPGSAGGGDELRGGLIARLQSRLGPRAVVRGDAANSPGLGIEIGIPVEREIWWIDFAEPAPRAALIDTIILWLAVLALVTLAAVLLSVHYVTRPIARLAAQIAAQHGRLRPIAEELRSSDELRRLVRSFNELVRTIDEANATRQQLLAGVSHDLRTPLARLRLRVETQCEADLAETMTGDLRSIEHIVDQFLAYVQGDRAPSAGREAALAACVAEVVARYAGQGLDVSSRLDGLGPRLPDLAVQRVLGNLIDNALAYGRAPVLVQVAPVAGGTALRVLDQGGGMGEEDFRRAQQPFVRLSQARSDLGHCGLGLAIVAQIARHWGAELRLAHEAGAFGIELVIPSG